MAAFSWLSGRWAGSVADDKADLNLMSAETGSLAGVAVIHRQDRIYSLELIHFVQTVQGVTIYLRHFSSELQAWEKNDPIALKLVSMNGEISNFEGKYNNQPYRWTITKHPNDTFSIHSEMRDEKGEQQVMDSSYVHVKQLTPLLKSH